MPAIFSSLIQSDFSSGDDHGNFEAVIRVGGELWHYWRHAGTHQWKPGQRITAANAAGAGAIVQSSMGDGHGNFEVVVPLRVTRQDVQLWHFVHFNDDVSSPWVPSQAVTPLSDRLTGPASLIQSNFGSGDHGNLELVVPIQGPHGHDELWHFFHDSSDSGAPWMRGQRVTGEWDRVAGPGCLIQSDYGSEDHGNFEVVVPLHGPAGHPELWHFFHDNSDVNSPWIRAQRVTDGFERVAGPGIILQSDFGDGDNGNLEVVVPIRTAHGHTELLHFFHDTDVESPWRHGQMITASASGWASFMRSDYGEGDHRNFEVLVEECHRPTIVHYWHHNADVGNPWLRGGPLNDPPRLHLEEPVAVVQGTRKIVQLTGEFDRQGWPGPSAGDPPFAHNRTESRWGVRGTDLGVSFSHKDRTYFLFGDTWWNPYHDDTVNLDSIAFCTDTNPDNGLDLTFHKQPPLIGGIGQREFEVPLDGLSFNGDMFVFFSTDYRKVGGYNLMGRSVVTVSRNDGYDFTYLWEFSRDKFVNVSFEVVDGREIGLQDYRSTLAIWGSGRYRSSDVYLAAMPLEEIASGRYVRYYAGQRDGQPVWAWNEVEAVPLFCSGSVGELSVRWNRFVGRWIILYNSDSPGGIIMRSAAKPWGDWSGPVVVFDGWIHAGYGHFMHIPWTAPNNPHDSVHDDMFGPPGDRPWRENEWAGVYGPYQIAPLARGRERAWTDLYFTMSVWNPYQVMLMTTRLRFGGPELPGTRRELIVAGGVKDASQTVSTAVVRDRPKGMGKTRRTKGGSAGGNGRAEP